MNKQNTKTTNHISKVKTFLSLLFRQSTILIIVGIFLFYNFLFAESYKVKSLVDEFTLLLFMIMTAWALKTGILHSISCENSEDKIKSAELKISERRKEMENDVAEKIKQERLKKNNHLFLMVD